MDPNTVLVEVLKQSPVALVLFWMVNIFKGRDEKKEEHIREMHNKFISVIENNTRVMTEVTNVVQENTKATETLSTRIYDVLTNKKNGNI